MKALLNYCIYIVIFLAAVSPWTIRNYIVYDNFSFSISQGSNLLFYNAAYLEAYKRGGYEHLDAIRKEMRGFRQVLHPELEATFILTFSSTLFTFYIFLSRIWIV